MSDVESEVSALHRRCSEIIRANGTPIRLEALWDGDTGGWFLCLYLTLRSASGAEVREFVTSLRYGSDLRLFNGQVPPWPESHVTRRLGELLEREFGCALWFPSPDQPDDDAPAYADRDRAIRCADCSKLVVPTTSPYLPKEVCYHCHLARERKAMLLAEPSGDVSNRAITLRVGLGGFACSVEAPLAALLVELSARTSWPLDLDQDQVLGAPWVAAMRQRVREEVTTALSALRPIQDERHRHFARTLEWEGRPLVLDVQFDDEHRRLADLIVIAENVEAASRSGDAVRVFSNAGVKRRDDCLLRRLRGGDGRASRDSVERQWIEPFGSRDAVRQSIDRLLAVGCLRAEGQELVVTEKGRAIDWPEES